MANRISFIKLEKATAPFEKGADRQFRPNRRKLPVMVRVVVTGPNGKTVAVRNIHEVEA